MPDADFVRTGAKIVDDADEVWGSADLVCKVKEPVEGEFHRLGARKRSDSLYVPAPGGVTGMHGGADRGAERRHRLRDGAQ